jgi:transposase
MPVPKTFNTPATVDSLLRVIEARDAEVALLKLMVDKLKMQLLRQLRARFGASSEQLNDPQIALIEGLPMHELAPVAKTPKAQAANSEGFDRSLPAHLPRENHVYRPEASIAQHDAAGQACACNACGGRLRQIGQDVSEQLEYVPSRFKVIRHVRPKLACAACESIFQAPAPSRPIARGIAGPGLLAHVMVSKYCDHQPLSPEPHLCPRGRADRALHHVGLDRPGRETAGPVGRRAGPLRAGRLQAPR